MTDPAGSPLEPTARWLSYRVKLDEDDRRAILALPCTVKTIGRNHFIVRERERPTHTCLMLSGYAVRSKVVRNGNRQILSVHLKGTWSTFRTRCSRSPTTAFKR